MTPARLVELLAHGATPEGVQILKRSPVRCVARSGDVVIKLLLRRRRKAAREAHTLRRARALGIPVPELIDSGPGWVATRFTPGTPALRSDLERLLPEVERMHARGMLHGDLHLGNILISASGPLFLDTQKARFVPYLPWMLRRWELGYLAYSLGDPLPPALASVRGWRTWRAQRHWRSRTRRCFVESSGFTAFAFDAEPGFRRREVNPEQIEGALRSSHQGQVIKESLRTGLYRCDGLVLKRHRTVSEARAAWSGGHGLEVRGIPTGLALAWVGRWLVMEDAGLTLSDWVDQKLEKASGEDLSELARACAELLANLHERGVYHADLKANNIAWQPGQPPRLLDYGRVAFGFRVPRRRRIKNLAQLNAALPDRVPDELRYRALRDYLTRTGQCADEARWLREVVAESVRRKHRWSGCFDASRTATPEAGDESDR